MLKTTEFYICCSVTKSLPTIFDPMECSTTGFPVLHYLQEFVKFTSIDLVLSSKNKILCHFLLLLPSILPASRSFPVNFLFESGGQNIGASASASISLMNIQAWYFLGLTDWIYWRFKGLSRVFSSTKVWKHQFFSTQPSLWSNSHIHTWLLEKT